MRWIYISPHLDDATLSAGGFLYDQIQVGNTVEIWTIVCGFPPPGDLTPFAEVLHQQWGFGTAEETVKMRRKEDLEAAKLIGVKSVHFDVPDCIYRRGPNGEPLYLEIFVEPHEAEKNLLNQIVETISTRLNPEDRVICQLGVGGHVDHLLVRQAVEKLNRPLLYSADIPYLFWDSEQLLPLVEGMKELKYSITEAGLEVWVEAVLAYKSQISTLFENKDDVHKKIFGHFKGKNGFSLWEGISPITS